MSKSAYYDSCIFLNALNKTHKEYASCLAITTPSNIKWTIWVCIDLVSAETTAAELVSAFEISCALAGVILVHTQLTEAKKLSANHKNEKAKLKKLQLKDRDFLHLMCAVSSEADYLITVDADFWDAKNKANPGAKKQSTATKKVIESLFPVEILSPTDLMNL